MAEHAPISRNPVTVASSTGGLASTAPRLRRLRGMRTRPSSGDEMNQVPPPSRKASATRMASTVLTWVAMRVVITGPTTQMTSWADASRENSGVS